MDIRTIFRKKLLSLGELAHNQDLEGIWVPDDLTADEVDGCIHALFREKAKEYVRAYQKTHHFECLLRKAFEKSGFKRLRRAVADPRHLLRGRQLGDPAADDLSQGRGDRLGPERRTAGHAQAIAGVAGDGRALHARANERRAARISRTAPSISWWGRPPCTTSSAPT